MGIKSQFIFSNEVDCPEQVLTSSFRRASMNLQRGIVLSPIRQGAIPLTAFQQAAFLLDVKTRIFVRLRSRPYQTSRLGREAFEAVAARHGDEHTYVQNYTDQSVEKQLIRLVVWNSTRPQWLRASIVSGQKWWQAWAPD